jgi:ATP-dependent Clp protease ATP-binding subunit ClpA
VTQKRLNPSKTRSDIAEIEQRLSERILFQPRAIRVVRKAITHSYSPFRRKTRPIRCILFVGPSGVGKTAIIRELSDILFEDPHAIVTIDGSEYGDRFTASRLLGAPPGYVGYDNPPLLQQERLDRPSLQRVRKLLEHTNPTRYQEMQELEEKIAGFKQEVRILEQSPRNNEIQTAIENVKEKIQQLQDKRGLILQMIMREHGGFFSMVLFDEVEKAHPKIWELLLQIFDEGRVGLANGETTSFDNSIVVLTSNVESRKMAQFASGIPMVGFSSAKKKGMKYMNM